MKRLALVLAVLVGASAPSAGASGAEITTTMSSADEGDPFDGSLSLRWQWNMSKSRITRERLCDNAADPVCGGAMRTILAREIDAERRRHTLNVDLRIGLYHDLEAFAVLPVVLTDVTDLGYADGVDQARSSVNPPASSGREALFTLPYSGPTRSGFGDMTIGLRYAPMAQWREPAYPTLRLAFSWTIPTGGVRRPGNDDVGLGLHQFRLETDVSRRISFVEPYFGFYGNLKYPGSSTLFNKYGDTQRYVSPGHDIGLTAGVEFFPWDEPREDGKKSRYLSIDVGFDAMYTFQGRDYTDLSDALGASTSSLLRYTRQIENPDPASAGAPLRSDGITDVGPFGTFSVWGGFNLQPIEYLELGFRFTYQHRTAHWLTMSSVGTDLDGDGGIKSANASGKNEYSPVYAGGDLSSPGGIDTPGHRFRSEGTHVLGVMLMLTGKY
jgi:hypothetical protein